MSCTLNNSCDDAPHQGLYAKLLDMRAAYLCCNSGPCIEFLSCRTGGRCVKERQKTWASTSQIESSLELHGNRTRSSLVVGRVTKLKGPVKCTYFYLYVILDIFSQLHVVGWMIAHWRTGGFGQDGLLKNSCAKQEIEHGPAYRSRRSRIKYEIKGWLHIFSIDLGVTREPTADLHVSNDEPVPRKPSSLNACLTVLSAVSPARMGSAAIQDARSF